MPMSVQSYDRAELLVRLRELVASLEVGDDAAFEAHFAGLVRAREQGLFVRVAKLTRHLHEAVRALGLDDQLVSATGRDIPDGPSRLDSVARVTEAAAHRAFDLVEQCQKIVQDIGQSSHDLASACQRAQLYSASPYALSGLAIRVDEVRAQIAISSELLRRRLIEQAQAQEYQDLAGQMIRRILHVVRGVEASLLDLLQTAGTPVAVRSAGSLPCGFDVAAVPGLGLSLRAISQGDAESLLADLGY